jgi:hypothetical protein
MRRIITQEYPTQFISYYTMPSSTLDHITGTRAEVCLCLPPSLSPSLPHAVTHRKVVLVEVSDGLDERARHGEQIEPARVQILPVEVQHVHGLRLGTRRNRQAKEMPASTRQ